MGRVILGAPRKKGTRNAQATRVGELIFTVGSPFNWDTGEIAGENIQEQTRQTMENIKTTLEACGSSLDHIDKCTVFVANREAVTGMNEVYYSYFPESTPVRSCILVAEFPSPRMMVEIEVVAHVK
jgi:2-iminobutanoate/2-iminopropanoate deaminase